MSKKFEELPTTEQDQVRLQIARQNYLTDMADVLYQCYYLNITLEEFYNIYLFSESPEEMRVLVNSRLILNKTRQGKL